MAADGVRRPLRPRFVTRSMRTCVGGAVRSQSPPELLLIGAVESCDEPRSATRRLRSATPRVRTASCPRPPIGPNQPEMSSPTPRPLATSIANGVTESSPVQPQIMRNRLDLLTLLSSCRVLAPPGRVPTASAVRTRRTSRRTRVTTPRSARSSRRGSRGLGCSSWKPCWPSSSRCSSAAGGSFGSSRGIGVGRVFSDAACEIQKRTPALAPLSDVRAVP